MELQNKKSNFGLILAVYLLGIFMGAIDTGIVSPARTVIQNNLLVDEKTGIWMITIYTLAYAASIPIMGKLADKFGRKYIYLLSIFLFGMGSLFCGLSQNFASFPLLLGARAVQAIGGGGILPIATAEFGTTFPKEKRGMALGLVARRLWHSESVRCFSRQCDHWPFRSQQLAVYLLRQYPDHPVYPGRRIHQLTQHQGQ